MNTNDVKCHECARQIERLSDEDLRRHLDNYIANEQSAAKRVSTVKIRRPPSCDEIRHELMLRIEQSPLEERRLDDWDLLVGLDVHILSEQGGQWERESSIGKIRRELMFRMIEKYPLEELQKMGYDNEIELKDEGLIRPRLQ
jgi:hypothetical protein